jgi:hypothetical protein
MYRHFYPVMGPGKGKKRVHFGVHFSKKGKDQISVWGVIEEAIVDLLKDKPYMQASAPRPPVLLEQLLK